MITGFITSQQKANAIERGIGQAFSARNLPEFWAVRGMPILSGEHEGKVFIPANDAILATPLRGNPPLTPMDYPEFPGLMQMLGGLDDRVEIDPATITPPADEI